MVNIYFDMRNFCLLSSQVHLVSNGVCKYTIIMCSALSFRSSRRSMYKCHKLRLQPFVVSLESSLPNSFFVLTYQWWSCIGSCPPTVLLGFLLSLCIQLCLSIHLVYPPIVSILYHLYNSSLISFRSNYSLIS